MNRANVYYVCQGEVDPEKVQMVGDELNFKPGADEADAELDRQRADEGG